MRRARHVRVAVAVLLALAGCAKAPPVPVDKFYRLPYPATPAAPIGIPAGQVVVVRPLRSSGVHNERAFVYAYDAEALVLERSHYHHWLHPPGQLLQEHLAARLRAAAPDAIVMTEPSPRADLVVTGKVERFEQHAPDGGEKRALVEVELVLSRRRAGKPLVLRDYRASETVGGGGVSASAAAFGRAVERVTAAFFADVRSALEGASARH